MNITKYFEKIKKYVKILMSEGHNVTDDAVLSLILDRLDFNYNSIVITLNSRIVFRYDKPILQYVQYLFKKMSLGLLKLRSLVVSHI